MTPNKSKFRDLIHVNTNKSQTTCYINVEPSDPRIEMFRNKLHNSKNSYTSCLCGEK